MRKLYLLHCMMFLAGVSYAQEQYYPRSPWAFANMDARTLGMGDAGLISTGPLATYRNPANLDTFPIFSFGISKEWRGTTDGNDIGEEDVVFLPLSAGFVVPGIWQGSLGFLYQKLMKWHVCRTESPLMLPYLYEIRSDLFLVSLGYRRSIRSEMELGATLNFTWGKSTVNIQLPEMSDMSYEYRARGASALISSSALINERARFALRLLSPTVLWVNEVWAESLESNATQEELDFRENIFWEVNGAMEYKLRESVMLAGQITYRDWRRRGGTLVWGDYEFGLNGGFEIHPLEFLILRGGGYYQLFYDALGFPASELRTVFLTCGIGIRVSSATLDIGIGKSVLVDHVNPEWIYYPNRFSILASICVFPEALLK